MSASWKVQRQAWSTAILTRKSIYCIKAPSSLFPKCPERQSVIVVYSVFLALLESCTLLSYQMKAFSSADSGIFLQYSYRSRFYSGSGESWHRHTICFTHIQEIYVDTPLELKGPKRSVKTKIHFLPLSPHLYYREFIPEMSFCDIWPNVNLGLCTRSNSVLQNSCLPRTCECDLIGK